MTEPIYDRGFALVLTVIIVTICITIGTIVMSLNVQNASINANTNRYMVCYYSADSQMLHCVDMMRTEMEFIYPLYQDPTSFFAAYNLAIDVGRIQPLDLVQQCRSSIDITFEILSEDRIRYRIQVIAEMEDVIRKFRRYITLEWKEEGQLNEMFQLSNMEEV